MAGWSAVAGTHDFVVPDESRAQALAKRLATFGFARVLARPRGAGTWIVIAVDEGPYPTGEVGHRTIDAVGRQATTLARELGGYPSGGSRFDPARPYAQPNSGSPAPIECVNPGARPPIPSIVLTPEPPMAGLAQVPDVVEAGAVDLSGLDDIDWASLGHAHGSAEDVPELIRILAAGDDRWSDALDALFGDDLLHQGTCYSATGPALAFVVRMLTSGTLPVRQRLDLAMFLLFATGRWRESLVLDADRAAAGDRLPRAAEWTQEVHLAVGEHLPALLARWSAEPPATRFVLACLAAHHPLPGRMVADEVSALAAATTGTQHGAYLRLAETLLRGDDTQALAVATEIVGWAVDLDPGWLEAPGISPALRATHVLAAGATRT